MIASMQPSHLLTDMNWAESRLGPKRAATFLRLGRAFCANGVVLAFGTDYPVEPVTPFRGVFSALTRTSEDGKKTYYPEQKLTIEQAIAAYTTGAAFAEFEEKQKGKFAPGMLADFVELDQDITARFPPKIIETRRFCAQWSAEKLFTKPSDHIASCLRGRISHRARGTAMVFPNQLAFEARPVRFTSLLLIVAIALACQSDGHPWSGSSYTRLDGSSITPAEIDATVTRLIRAAEVTGVSVAIFNGGKIVYLKAYGVRDKEKNLALTEDSVMTAASFSKAAFAYMVMQLIDDKILDLDKPVYQYLPKPLPEYSNYQDLANDPRYRKITARMLLSHTSGFPNWRSLNEDRN